MTHIRTTYLSLGSNQGNRVENLQQGINLLSKRVGHITQISSVYQTDSWGFSSTDFYNICVQITTLLNPQQMLIAINKIEQELGRVRNEDGTYSDRTIDIDILFFDDVIVDYERLIIPHPRLYKRNFVLVPLAEIAPDFCCPVEGKSISELLKECSDSCEVKPVGERLQTPPSPSNKYRYISIEGNIGSGKTSLTHLLSQNYNGKMILERFEENPFLPKFYQNQKRYAFPLEMSFLADRYQQFADCLSQFNLFTDFIVSDYHIIKSLIFAQVTLDADESNLYRRIFDVMNKDIAKPDLYVYLYQNTKRLLENISKRGRNYEQNIQASYLEEIQQGYLNFIKTAPHLNTKIIDVSDLDFVENKEDFYKIVELIME